MTEFTGFFKSAENEGLFLGTIKGDRFEILCETRNPDTASKCLRDAFPAAVAEVPVKEQTVEPVSEITLPEEIETLPCNSDNEEEELI